MDIYCPNCGEPWEIDTLHEYAEESSSTFTSVMRVFQSDGCSTAFNDWGVTCEKSEENSERAMIASIAYEILGDDIDGAASMFDDWEYLNG